MWMVRVVACLVGVLFIIYLFKNAARISHFVAGRVARPESQDFWKEEYAWALLVVLLIVTAVLLLPFVLDLITKSVAGG